MTEDYASFCWWCNGPLVGPGGIAGRKPLYYREVSTMPDGFKVRVHAKCEPDTKAYFTDTTAQPRTA